VGQFVGHGPSIAHARAEETTPARLEKSIWSKDALVDLDRVAGHLRGGISDPSAASAAADMVVQRLIAAAEGLTQFPLIGRPYGDRRRFVVDEYCLFYRVGRNPLSVRILRLRHGKELPYRFEAED
jgi:plasmid stabilization system protein ParE